MADFSEALVHAFPKEFVALARAVVSRLPPSQVAPSTHSIGPIRINRQPNHIPARIYVDPVSQPSKVNNQSTENRIATCLYTRHHDGYVRERFLRALLPVRTVWEVPFVLQLIGEYVVEIISAIETRLSDDQAPLFTQFACENAEFIRLTQQRLTSYWNCYYRYQWSRLADYPGMRVMKQLENWSTLEEARGGPPRY